MTTRFHIDCEMGHKFVTKITNYLLKVIGVYNVYVDITLHFIEIEHNPYIDTESIKASIENLGISVVGIT